MTAPQHDSATTAYRERHVAPLGWWIGATIFAATMGWILWVPTQATGPTVVATVLGAAVSFSAVWGFSHYVVEASPAGLRAGPAHIDAAHLGGPRVVEATEWRWLLGPGSDHQAYLITRPWLRAGVLFPVVDDSDPTPYWLVGARRPAELAAALGRGLDEGEPRGEG